MFIFKLHSHSLAFMWDHYGSPQATMKMTWQWPCNVLCNCVHGEDVFIVNTFRKHAHCTHNIVKITHYLIVIFTRRLLQWCTFQRGTHSANDRADWSVFWGDTSRRYAPYHAPFFPLLQRGLGPCHFRVSSVVLACSFHVILPSSVATHLWLFNPGLVSGCLSSHLRFSLPIFRMSLSASLVVIQYFKC